MEVVQVRYPKDTRMRESATSREKIVGILCNDEIIRTGADAIIWVQLNNDYKYLITQAHAEFMAACDLGKQWEDLSKCKPIFCNDKDGYFLTKEMVTQP